MMARRPLFTAVQLGDIPGMNQLLNASADPNTTNKYGMPPLVWLINYPTDRISLLSNAYGPRDKRVMDAREQLISVVRLLLERGANNENFFVDGVESSMLHECAKNCCSPDILYLLLDSGANYNRRISGKKASQVATDSRCSSVANILEEMEQHGDTAILLRKFQDIHPVINATLAGGQGRVDINTTERSSGSNSVPSRESKENSVQPESQTR